MKTLKESLLSDIDTVLKLGDDYTGNNTFPKKTDFKKNALMKGSRYMWIFSAFKDIYRDELLSYFKSSTRLNWVLKQYDEIKGISVHVKKDANNVYSIEVYLEGVSRGSFTEAGILLPHIRGTRITLAQAKDAAYKFLCNIKNNEDIFKDALFLGELKQKYNI